MSGQGGGVGALEKKIKCRSTGEKSKVGVLERMKNVSAETVSFLTSYLS